MDCVPMHLNIYVFCHEHKLFMAHFVTSHKTTFGLNIGYLHTAKTLYILRKLKNSYSWHAEINVSTMWGKCANKKHIRGHKTGKS